MEKQKEVSEFCLGDGVSPFGEYTFRNLLGTDEIFRAVILAGVNTSQEGGSCFERNKGKTVCF